MKNLIPASLDHNVYAKEHTCNSNSKQYIYVQKIKIQIINLKFTNFVLYLISICATYHQIKKSGLYLMYYFMISLYIVSEILAIYYNGQPFFFFFSNWMFYQLRHVQHSCSSTQSWGSVLPSIVETRNQNSRGCPLLFSNRNLGSCCA